MSDQDGQSVLELAPFTLAPTCTPGPRSSFRPGRRRARSAPRPVAWVRRIYPAQGTGDFSRPCARSRRTEVRLPQVPTEVGVPRGTARGLRSFGNRGEVAETTIKAHTCKDGRDLDPDFDSDLDADAKEPNSARGLGPCQMLLKCCWANLPL